MPKGAAHLTDAEQHAADLAASRYGVDRARLQQTLKNILHARAQGRPADLLETLLAQHLLTVEQANDLRLALDTTHLDAAQQGNGKAGGNGPLPLAAQEPRSLGEYRILRRLGEGGMGSVYLGYHEKDGRHVAIKVLPEHLAGNASYVERFYREARSAAALDHPNIVRGLDARLDPATNKHYLVLEYVDGPSAHTLLQQYGRLAVGDAVGIARDIARALEHAHSRNIVHRDIKPDNILLTKSGVPKLADLGLAKRTDEASHLTAARQGFGTPYYMPYEQAMNAKYADGRSDIFALGATLYHLVTGEVPFPGGTHLEIVDKKNAGDFPPASRYNDAVPAALDRILTKMLARLPEKRYQTASELIVDLDRSGLAAPVPSFVDRDVALQDPVVRQRLAEPAQPTRADLEAPAANGKAAENTDVWYLRYRNAEGRLCKGKVTTAQIEQRLREGRLTMTVEASRQPQGEFKPLAAYDEFRAVASPSPSPTPRKKSSVAGTRRDAVRRRALPEPSATLEKRLPWLVLVAVGVLTLCAVTAYFMLGRGPG